MNKLFELDAANKIDEHLRVFKKFVDKIEIALCDRNSRENTSLILQNTNTRAFRGNDYW